MNSYRRPVHFRRSKIPRRKNSKKAKINTAVLIVLIFVIVCIVGTVMLGNYLKNRADDTSIPKETLPPETDADTTRTSEGLSTIEPAEGSVRSGCLDIKGVTDAAELDEKIRYIFASGYDSITVPIADDGSLLYYSPAAIALSHMQKDSLLPSLTDIISRIKKIAEEYRINPTVTAFYTLTSPNIDDPVLMEAAFLFDTAIVAEAHSLGADEILVSGFSLAEKPTEATNAVISFVEKLRATAKDIRIGLALPAETYMADNTAHHLETISSAVEYLAVETSELDWSHTVTEDTVYNTDENGDVIESVETVHLSSIYETLTGIAESIKGSTSLYGLRFLLNGDDPYTLVLAIDALALKNAHDFYVVTPTPVHFADEDDETDEDEEDTAKTQKPDKEDTKKPETKPPETTKKETTEAVTETESETTINPENWEWILG